jgi:hypothetical protein
MTIIVLSVSIFCDVMLKLAIPREITTVSIRSGIANTNDDRIPEQIAFTPDRGCHHRVTSTFPNRTLNYTLCVHV